MVKLMVNLKRHPKHNLLYLIIFIILLSGCGSDMNTASTNTASNDTDSALDYDYQSLSEGSAVFSLKWETPSKYPFNKDLCYFLSPCGRGEG